MIRSPAQISSLSQLLFRCLVVEHYPVFDVIFVLYGYYHMKFVLFLFCLFIQ